MTNHVSFQYPDDPGMHNEPRHRYARPSYRGANPGIWDRMKANLIAIVVGMFLICIAFGLIFWNEVCVCKPRSIYNCIIICLNHNTYVHASVASKLMTLMQTQVHPVLQKMVKIYPCT